MFVNKDVPGEMVIQRVSNNIMSYLKAIVPYLNLSRSGNSYPRHQRSHATNIIRWVKPGKGEIKVHCDVNLTLDGL